MIIADIPGQPVIEKIRTHLGRRPGHRLGDSPWPGPTRGLTLRNREHSGDPATRAAGAGWVRGFAEPMETDW